MSPEPTPAPVAPPAPVLEYDDLPPGSDLRRDWRPGGLTVVSPPGEVSPHARRAAAAGTLVGAVGVWACMFGLIGLVGCVLFLPNIDRLDSGLRPLAALLFGIVGLGALALVWRAEWHARVGILEKARRQSTVLSVTPARLRVETAGPFGPASLDLPSTRVRGLHVTRARFRATPGPWMVVVLDDGTEVRLLAGREEVELRWVVRAVGRVMGLGDG